MNMDSDELIIHNDVEFELDDDKQSQDEQLPGNPQQDHQQ